MILPTRATRAKYQLLMTLITVCSIPNVLAQTNSIEIQRHSERAREALVQHDLQRAYQEYVEILKLDSRNAEIHAALGMTLYGMGKPREAAAALQTALNLDASQTTAELFLGLSKSDLGQCGEAIPLLRKNFKDQTERKVRRLVGLSLLNCYVGASELEQALEQARILKQLYPDDPDILYNLARIYSQLWNVTVSELVKKTPDSYRVHQLAGETLEAQGRNEQAIKEYLKALEINPKLPRLHFSIGRLIVQQGRDSDADKRALDHFQQELAVNSLDAPSEYEIGEIFRKRHNLEQAKMHFLGALELSADFVEARIGLAKVYSAEHQPEKALIELKQATRQQPQNSAAHYALMLLYRDLGKVEEAKSELATFQGLEDKKEKDFRSLLQSLLAEKGTNTERPR